MVIADHRLSAFGGVGAGRAGGSGSQDEGTQRGFERRLFASAAGAGAGAGTSAAPAVSLRGAAKGLSAGDGAILPAAPFPCVESASADMDLSEEFAQEARATLSIGTAAVAISSQFRGYGSLAAVKKALTCAAGSVTSQLQQFREAVASLKTVSLAEFTDASTLVRLLRSRFLTTVALQLQAQMIPGESGKNTPESVLLGVALILSMLSLSDSQLRSHEPAGECKAVLNLHLAVDAMLTTVVGRRQPTTDDVLVECVKEYLAFAAKRVTAELEVGQPLGSGCWLVRAASAGPSPKLTPRSGSFWR